jgi:hypothetical protein
VTEQALIEQLSSFLQSSLAVALCHRYGVEPDEALGELYLRLSPKTQQPIRKPSVWIRVNATGLLRNFLRAEYRELRQTREEKL